MRVLPLNNKRDTNGDVGLDEHSCQTGSSGSSTLSVTMQSSEAHVLLLEETIDGLTTALTEVQAELRDQTAKSEVLRTTVVAVSKALQISEDCRRSIELQTERLNLKLSSLTYADIEHDDEGSEFSDGDVIEVEDSSSRKSRSNKQTKRHKKAKKSKKAKKAAKRSMKNNEDHSDLYDSEDDETETEEENDGFDSLDDSFTEDGGDIGSEVISESEVSGESTPGEDALVSTDPPITSPQDTPCQAAFYRVLLERDIAQAQAERYRNELSLKEALVKDLRNRLNKSVALVELSYNDDNSSNPKKDKGGRLRKSSSVTSRLKPERDSTRKKWFHGKSTGDGEREYSFDERQAIATTDHADQAAGVSTSSSSASLKESFTNETNLFNTVERVQI